MKGKLFFKIIQKFRKGTRGIEKKYLKKNIGKIEY